MTAAVPCLAIGSEVVRWNVPGRDDRACESSTYFWRDKHGELPPFVGEMYCNRTSRFAPLRLGDWPDADVAGPLAGLLKEVRRDGATSRWWKPSRLLVALSPAFAARLAPFVPVAARAAGFRRAVVVEEADCLVKAAGPWRPLAIVDIGDAETRIFVWTRSSSTPDVASSVAVGGRRLADDMTHALRGAGLLVTHRSARSASDAEGGWPRPTKGYDTIARRPRTMAVERATALTALESAESQIAAACAEAIARAPRSTSGGVVLVLAGAAAAFVGLREAIASQTACAVDIAVRPGAEVLRGLEVIRASTERR